MSRTAAPRRCALVALISGIALIAQSCIGLEKSYPDREFFVLEAARPTGDSTSRKLASEVSLKLKTLRAAPQCDGKDLVYRRSSETYESDFYHQFFVAPAPMVTEVVRRWLDDAQLFDHVVDAASQLSTSHVLEGSLKALYADLNTEPATAVLELQLFLLDDRPQIARVAYQRNFTKVIPISEPEPAAMVIGWNRALSEILTELESDWRKVDWSAR